MRRFFPLLIVLLALTGVACPPAPKDDPIKKDNVKIEDKKASTPASLVDLKKRIDAALEHVHDRDLLVKHGFWTIFHAILGQGPEKTMLTDLAKKEKFNAMDYICEGGEIKGLQFIPTKDGLDVQIGPQFEGQGHQDQFVAEMAQWGMPRDRKFRVGDKDFTFNDFVRKSKARASTSDKEKQELSWAVVLIPQYHGTDHAWTNSAGEALTVADMVRYEVNASIDEAACGGTHRLFGLTWAYHLHLKTGGKKEGVWLDVETKIDTYKKLARKLRNSDDTLSTLYFKGPEHKADANLRISTTGHIVEWLALAMTDDELRASWMQNTVSALAMLMIEQRDQAIDGGALYHAAHGLHLYRERVFGTPAPYLPLPPKK